MVAVVTQPDKPGDRGEPAPRPVAAYARDHGSPVLQPASLRDESFRQSVEDARPDVLVVASYGKIIPGWLLSLPRLGGINVHGSLLPRWRGAAPIHAAVLAGDRDLGVTIMQMDEGMDTGPVLETARMPYGAHDLSNLPETFDKLVEEMAECGGAVLGNVLLRLGNGEHIPPRLQEEESATLAPKITRASGNVEWNDQGADRISRMVYAYRSWPGVSCLLGGRRVHLTSVDVHAARLEGEPGCPVAIVPEGLAVATVDGTLVVKELRPEGRHDMTARSFVNGIPALRQLPRRTLDALDTIGANASH